MATENIITLYDYQATKIESALRHVRAGRDVLLEESTGSGKTLQGVALLGITVGKEFSHAIVIAPQRQIEAGFIGRNGSRIHWPAEANRNRPIRIPAGFIRTARKGRRGAVDGILAYLATPNPGYVLATTHSAINHLFRNRLAEFPEHLKGCLLFVDEAHHVGADGLSIATKEWAARGGRQVYATATPYRGDGIDPVREGMARLRRTITEQIEAGFAPKHLGNEIVALGAKGDHVTGREFAGESVPSRKSRKIAKAMVAKWVAKGKPKTIIRVPPLKGGCQPLIADLMRLLRKSGARVLDATGTGKGQQKRFLAALDAERSRTFAESQYDAIIGCMRVLEGSDWPLCSHVFCLGIPRPIGTVIQLIGRAMRKKAGNHPSAERAEIVFFVPCAGGDALGSLSLDHSRHALLVAAYMADYAVGEEYAVVDAVRKGLGIKPGDDFEIEVDEALRIDPSLIAEAKVHITQAVEDRPEITLPELVDHVVSAMPKAPRNDVVGIVLRIKATEKTPVGQKVNGAIKQGFAEAETVRPDIAATRRRVFEEVLEKFRDETLADSDGLKAFAAQVHAITAGNMRGVTERLRDAWARGGPLTIEMILGWIRKWKERTGSFPNQRSGVIPGTNEKWCNIDRYLWKGTRGLPGGSSLSQLVVSTFGTHARPRRYDLRLIHNWVSDWKEASGKYPTGKQGEIPNSGGQTWRGLNQAFRSSHPDLAGFTSLADYITKEFGVRTKLHTPALNDRWVICAIKKYVSANGFFPTKTSGEIPESDGETWCAIDQAIRAGRRGMSKLSGLGAFITKHFPDAPPVKMRASMAFRRSHAAKRLANAS